MFKKRQKDSFNFLDSIDKVKNVYENLPPIKKRRRKNIIYKMLKFFVWAFVSFFVLFFIFLLLSSVNLFNVFKEARNGKNNVEQAVYFAKAKDFKTANDYSKLATYNFSQAKERLAVYNNFILDNVFYINEQKNNLFYLISAADALSQAVVIGTGIGVDLQSSLNNDQSFLKLTKEEKRTVLGLLFNNSNNFKIIQQKIDFADNELKKVKISGFLKFGKDKIVALEDQVAELNLVSKKMIPFMELLPKFLGYPERSDFLFVLQNSDELRPTGGFIGTYGILQTEDSDLLRSDTHDVYHMDMPIKDVYKVEPPTPLKQYLGVDSWFLRDANWSPDWPSSARKIGRFYKEENALLTGKNDINNFRENFDGVIGITPKIITDLLQFIGPIVIEGVEYNQGNFVDLLQYRVERGYVQLGVSSWQRKEVIGEIAKELKKRIFDLSLTDLYKVSQIVGNNIDQKNILIFFYDTTMEDIVLKQGWGGNLIDGDSDYLLVVDANMASLKTDAVINRRLDYKLNFGDDRAQVELKIKYIHNGVFDWKTTRYRNYVRVYVPEGSKLVQYGGFDGEKVMTYNELGKTVFGAFVSIEPGHIEELILKYELPLVLATKIKNNKEYGFYLQKQPGSKYESFNLEFNFDKKIKDYQPVGLFANKGSDKKISWSDSFETDREFKVLVEEN